MVDFSSEVLQLPSVLLFDVEIVFMFPWVLNGQLGYMGLVKCLFYGTTFAGLLCGQEKALSWD